MMHHDAGKAEAHREAGGAARGPVGNSLSILTTGVSGAMRTVTQSRVAFVRRWRTHMKEIGLALAVTAVSCSATAYAAGEATQNTDNLFEMARVVYKAVMSGDYVLAAALALVLLVAVATRYLSPYWPFLTTEAGKMALVVAGSFGGAVATAKAAGAPVSAGLLWTALGVAVTAAGGYKMVRVLLVPAIEKLRDKTPTWIRWLPDLVLWVFARDTKAIEKAAKAGEDAVKKNPPTGTSGVIGAPRDVP